MKRCGLDVIFRMFLKLTRRFFEVNVVRSVVH